MGKPVGQGFIVTSKNRGFSLIEVVVVVAVMALAITSLSLLFLRVNLTKSANKNLLTASTLAEDILEHIRETSIGIEDCSKLAEALIVDDDTKVFGPDDTDDSDGFASLISLIYGVKTPATLDTLPEAENLSAALDTLPEARDLSSVTFEVKERNLINNAIEKLMVTVVIRWKEIARNPDEQEREYRLTTYITKSGLREFLREFEFIE